MSRIDDFDPSRDTIWFGSTQINLSALPPNARIVEFWGQQFLLIGTNVVIALEAARLGAETPFTAAHGTEEPHFRSSVLFAAGASAIFDQPSVAYVDPVNFVPWNYYSAIAPALNRIINQTGTVTGNGGQDHFIFGAGDLVDWDLLTGTTAQKYDSTDLITDFTLGQDKIKLTGLASGMSGLTISQYTIGTNVYCSITINATSERLLVDVADTVTLAQFSNASNFIFI